METKDLKIEIWENEKAWDEFVSESPYGSVFCCSSFIKALETPYKIYKVSKGAEVLVAFPIFFDANGEIMRAPHYFTMYQGPIFSAKLITKDPHSFFSKQLLILDWALEQLAKKYPRLSFCLHYNMVDIRGFQWFRYNSSPDNHFKIDLRYTGLLDVTNLSNEESILENVRSVRRYEYRQSIKSNMQIRHGSIKDLELFCNLYLETFARQEIQVSEQEMTWVKNITQSSLNNNYGELAFAVNENGEELAAVLFLYDKKSSYYFYSATDTKYRKSGANTYLLIEFIKITHSKKLKYLDMIGINSPGRGDFKLSFNADPHNYFVVHWDPKDSWK